MFSPSVLSLIWHFNHSDVHFSLPQWIEIQTVVRWMTASPISSGWTRWAHVASNPILPSKWATRRTSIQHLRICRSAPLPHYLLVIFAINMQTDVCDDTGLWHVCHVKYRCNVIIVSKFIQWLNLDLIMVKLSLDCLIRGFCNGTA